RPGLPALPDPQRLDHPPPAEVHAAGLHERAGGDAQVAHLALADEVAERAERLVERRLPVVAVDLVEFDPVGAQPAQALLHLQEDVPARRAAIEHPTGSGHEDLGGDDGFLAPALERLADDLLRLSHRVAVRGIDEGDALVERAAHDPDALVVVGVPPPSQRHRAEADARDLEAAVPEPDVLHGYAARASVIACRRARSSGATLLGKKARTSPSLPTTYLQKFQLGASPPRVRKA